MEINSSIPWLDESHPNYERWKRGRDLSIDRGNFVRSVIGKFIIPENLVVLDLGSGEGGTSFILSENNFVFSFDFSFVRLIRQSENFDGNKINRINGDARHLPFSDSTFDLIILQDVIEHIESSEIMIDEIKRILKPGGVIYLSTPNRLSVINMLADPHWGMPFLSLFKRKTIQNFYLKVFRKQEKARKDIAELLSLNDLINLFKKNYDINLLTNYSVTELFKGNKGIVWSDFHLWLIKIANATRINKIIACISNNNTGFINKYLTPTFYIILKKK